MQKNYNKYPKGSEWRKWDLHVHSDASDGKMTCEQIVSKAIENKIGSMFSGEYIDQFIRVQPSSSVIYAPYPSDDPKYNSYVEKCMRRNYTSIVEAVTVQNQFTKSTIGILKNLLNMRDL